MSPDIALEIYFLFCSFLTGVLITVLYDCLRILRRVVPHNIAAVSLEDLLYWMTCSVIIFAMLIRENNGMLRWFAVAGAMAGILLKKKTLGFLFVKYISLLFLIALHLVEKILHIVFKPLYLVLQRIKWSRRRAGKPLKMGLRGLKKKLTEGRKMLKIILSKR